MTEKKGCFITLEGGEGVGKSTNIPFVKHYLEQQGLKVVVTREPGGTPSAEKIRDVLLYPHGDEVLANEAEILLMFAARAQHISHVIKPALAEGCWVLCDRFTDATYAYQGGGRGISVDTIQWLEKFVQGDLTPDLTILLDTPVEIGMMRAKNRGGRVDRFEAEQLHFFGLVREHYLQRAQCYSERIKVVNANQSIDAVQKAIIEALKPLLK